MRESVRAHAEVDVAVARPTPGRAPGRWARAPGSVSPSTSADVGFDDPRLLGGDVGERGPDVLDVVDAHVGDHRDVGVDDVGGVPGAPEARPRPRPRRPRRRRTSERGRGEDLEVAGRVGEQVLDRGDGQEQLVEHVVGDRARRSRPCARSPGRGAGSCRSRWRARPPRAGPRSCGPPTSCRWCR